MQAAPAGGPTPLPPPHLAAGGAGGGTGRSILSSTAVPAGTSHGAHAAILGMRSSSSWS